MRECMFVSLGDMLLMIALVLLMVMPFSSSHYRSLREKKEALMLKSAHEEFERLMHQHQPMLQQCNASPQTPIQESPSSTILKESSCSKA